MAGTVIETMTIQNKMILITILVCFLVKRCARAWVTTTPFMRKLRKSYQTPKKIQKKVA